MAVRCPECGMENPDGSEWCVECGSQISNVNRTSPSALSSPEQDEIDTSLPPILSQPYPTTSPETSWWKKLRPDLKASLVFIFGQAVLAAINSATVGAGCIASFPFYIAISLGQGVMVARLASQDGRYTKADYLKLGLLSGLWTNLLIIVQVIVSGAIIIGVTLMTAVAALPIMIVSHFGVIALTMTLTALGSWMYGKYGGKKLISAIVVVGVLSTIIVCVLMLVVSAILAAVGISLWNQLG